MTYEEYKKRKAQDPNYGQSESYKKYNSGKAPTVKSEPVKDDADNTESISERLDRILKRGKYGTDDYDTLVELMAEGEKGVKGTAGIPPVPAPVGNAKLMSKLLDVDESKMPSVSDTNESLEKNIDNVRALPKYSTVRGLFDKLESKGDKKTEPSEMSYVDEHKIKSTVPLVADADDMRMRNPGFKTASDRIGELQSAAQDDPDFNKYVKLAKDRETVKWKDVATGKYDDKPFNKVKYADEHKDGISKSAVIENNNHKYGIDGAYTQLTDDEKKVYNYYFGKGDYENADKYLMLLKPELDKRWSEYKKQEMAAFSKESPILASAMSVGYNAAAGAEMGGDLIRYAASGGKSDVRNDYADITSTIRGSVSEDMSGVGRFLYNTGMSGLDSLAVMPMGGLGTVFLGSSAAASATNDALDRGMSGGRALANGVAAGVFEGLFEKFSIGNFKALKDVPVKGFKDVVVNGLKSMGVNASEEMATEIANITYDTVVNGKYANRTWDDMASGEWKNALIDVLGAGISGAVMGAGFNAIGNVGADINAKRALGGAQNELVGAGLVMPEGSRAHTLATKNQAKLDAGKNLSGRALRYQIGANADIPIVPGSKADVEADVGANDVSAKSDTAQAAKDFSAYAQGVFEAVDNDTYAAELMDDADVSAAVADMDAAVSADAEFTPSEGVIEARDPNAEYFETGRLVPLTAEQEWRKMEAAKAKTDTERSGILAGVDKADIDIALTMSKFTGRNIIFKSDEYNVNGHFDGINTVFVNPSRESGDIVSQVIAHELAHAVEGTKAYKALMKSLKAFVEANNYVDSDGIAHDWDYYITEAHAKSGEHHERMTGETFTDAKAEHEAVAKIMQSFFSDTSESGTSTQVALDKWLAEYTKANRTGVARMWYSLSKLARRFREDISAKFSKSNTPEAQKQREMLRRIEDIRDRFGRALLQAKKVRGTNGKAAYSVNGAKITVESSDEERTAILSKKSIGAPVYDGQADVAISENQSGLEGATIKLKKAALLKIGEMFDIFDHDISIEDIDIVTQVSRGTLKESVSKDIDPIKISKLLPILKSSIEKSVGIECHKNRYYFDDNTVYFENLFGGYIDGDMFIPVRYGLKHDKSGKATLYVVIDQEAVEMRKIDPSYVSETKKDQGHQSTASVSRSHTPHLVNISIPQVIQFVNSKDIIEYFPDGLLSEKQIESKRVETTKAEKKTTEKNDKKYSDFVKDQKIGAASRMLYNKRNDAGFTNEIGNGQYSDDENHVKTGEITYDDNGELIPISKRYDGSNPDTRYSFTESDNYGTMPMTERESMMRDRALDMYAKLDKGEDIGMPDGMDDAGEYIYGLTGWFRDEFGNLMVDHEAPVYQKERTSREMAAERHADQADAFGSAMRSENAALREDVAQQKRRAEAAEKAKKVIERDFEKRIRADRKLSPDYVPSRNQVRDVVNGICDMLGGGFSDRQKIAFAARLLDIYDRMHHDGSFDLRNYTNDIVGLISDMQDVNYVNEDNKALADAVRPELKTPIYLSETARGDLSEGYGKTARKYRGHVNLVSKERGTPVDVRYMELSGRFPDLFPADIINEADQLKQILKVSDEISDKSFTSRDRYAELGADPDVLRDDDLSKAILRIVEGFEKVEAVPRTFADGLMRQLEYERREHQRELARMTEAERVKAEKKHEAEMERLMRDAEAAMEWETKYLRDALSEAEGKIKASEDARKADEKAEDRREHLRGRDIQDAAIKAAQDDGSFTQKMLPLYERQAKLEDEYARVRAKCDQYAKVDISRLSKDEAAFVKQLRDHRDALLEDKSNLEAYINKVNQRVKAIRFKTMTDMIAKEKLDDWHDKMFGFQYQTETMRRNILDSKPKNRESALADYIISEILDPIVTSTYRITQMRQDIRAKVKELNLSRKVKSGDTLSESQFVQALGEARDNIAALDSGEGTFIYNRYGEPMREGMTADEWRGYLNRIIEENPGITGDEANMKRMEDAVAAFKTIYDDLFTIVNAARVRNGYAPVPYHRGYFPHYNNVTAQDGVFSRLLQGFGFRQNEISEKLPTSINGMTSTFRPGIKYMSNAKRRSMAGVSGDRDITGAVEGIDRYIEVATDVAFMTDHIQELRTLADAIRYETTSEATKKRIDEINADDTLSLDEKRVRKDEVFANKSDKTKYALNKLVPDIEEYANILAGKKSRYDRDPENLFGRSLYTAARKFMSRVASNQIVMNVGSWITNTVPVTTGTAVMHYHMLSGFYDMILGRISSDGFAASSQFLTNRRGSDRLVKSGMEKASGVLGSGMTGIDSFIAEWLMRARVRQNMSKSRGKMSFEAAMAEADTFISGMMGQRTKAEMPTIFAAQNPLFKMFTMYQLEVKNQFGFLFKDLPRELEGQFAKYLAELFVIFLLSRIYNDFFEELTGRRPAFDPLEMLNDMSGDLTGYKMASADEFFGGEFVKEVDKKNPVKAAGSLGKSAVEEMPFIGGLLGGGRVPVSAAMFDYEALGRAFSGITGNFYDEDDTRSEGAAGFGDIIENLYKGFSPMIYNGIIPMGGGQIKKMVEGGVAIAQGGSYNYSTEGERQLQYPMYTDDGNIWNEVKTILFGKTASDGGREWVEGGFGQLSAKRTAVYEDLLDVGISQKDAFGAVKAVAGAGSTQLDKARVLLELDIDDEGKLILFGGIVTTSEKKLAAAEAAVDTGDLDAYLEGLIAELEEDAAADDEEDDKAETQSKGKKSAKTETKSKSPSSFDIEVPKFDIPKFDLNI